jgi:hypothetical protein
MKQETPRPPPGNASDELRQPAGLKGRCELRALLASHSSAAAAAAALHALS